LPAFVTNSSLAGTLAALFSAATLTAVLTFVIRWRGQSFGSEERLRADMGRELAALRDQLIALERHYRDMLRESDRRHEECQLDRQRLQERVRHLEQEVTGLHAQIRAASTERVLVMEKNCPPQPLHSTAAAHRVKKINDNGGK
jgi:hypothetical protein